MGIAGGSGSGKSTYCDIIAKELKDYQVDVVSTDDFYKKDLPKMISPVSNVEYDDFNHSDALDYNKLMEYLNNLLRAEIPPEVVILEGIFTLYFEELRKMLDVKIFVDLDSDERMYRRISRNMKNWGVGFEEVATYYLDAAKHREIEFVLRTKNFADIVIHGNHLEGISKNIISCWISSMIRK
ncbi:AAA family ATPase [Paenibacillus sp. MER TA 81-3]|uniref:AAA family ATPase n=1 Tax=Paenibacillus sp. MER TA 81-3 TaxID=2939573 RepID=UPI00203BB3EF|nr:AAA family ATPase [Paenibacillus sp. MER TA 81-3]MCM3337465.1 AAA family ATPase [Paenibacillus sp. MER TA 81-3]